MVFETVVFFIFAISSKSLITICMFTSSALYGAIPREITLIFSFSRILESVL